MEEVIVEEVNAKVEVVGKKEDKFAPIVCYYSSGFNPQRKRENSEEEEDDDGVEVKTIRTETRVEVVVTPKDYKLDFVGESHSGEPAASQVCCYSLAIFDKESQTLKIVPVAANKILRLEPKVRTPSICDKEPLKELKEEDQTPAKKAYAIDRTITAYGTKTAYRNAIRLQILHRAEDAETQKAIDEKTQNVKLNKKALATASGAPTRNIPPHDSSADTPEKAYPIDRIILPGEWDSLLDILELVQSQADIKPDTYPSFVCNRIHKLQEIQDEEERKKLACIFSYITHLIKFRDLRSVDRNSSLRNHWIPTILNTKFLSMFADSEKYNPSPDKINLLISYVLVLTLIADGYQTDMGDIARDLKMSIVDLREHYFNLGCKFKKEQKMIILTLPTPLEFPKLRMKKGPKRKR
ncbi:Dna-directed rna polymerase i subunit rpa49 [Thalictrum thalictroides]|uniref:Dna-directed rna polymerase i subunit rpa49 n=1 Tax=Thalictrum thalictroides TaxID=46969 RepID=A0A7J6VZS8_THATH|nr:Dna-directed rna polymerase i subunit rpa49 [Thalictrum thalictroides]